jgi:hypothetical protein
MALDRFKVLHDYIHAWPAVEVLSPGAPEHATAALPFRAPMHGPRPRCATGASDNPGGKAPGERVELVVRPVPQAV